LGVGPARELRQRGVGVEARGREWQIDARRLIARATVDAIRAAGLGVGVATIVRPARGAELRVRELVGDDAFDDDRRGVRALEVRDDAIHHQTRLRRAVEDRRRYAVHRV